MSLIQKGGEVVHIPKRRDVFEFDDEVAAIFQDMATRSIPMYEEVHRLHCSLLHEALEEATLVVDVGSSTGHLFGAIEHELGFTLSEAGIEGLAIDSSPHMMGELRTRFPTVVGACRDITEAVDLKRPADIIFCLYTLQFIPPERKALAFDWIVRNLKLGGYLVLGQKESVPGVWADMAFTEEYHQFRRDNGYTQAEIDAKTSALAGSMWPISIAQIQSELAARGVVTYPTSRWLQFSTLIGVRRE